MPDEIEFTAPEGWGNGDLHIGQEAVHELPIALRERLFENPLRPNEVFERGMDRDVEVNEEELQAFIDEDNDWEEGLEEEEMPVVEPPIVHPDPRTENIEQRSLGTYEQILTSVNTLRNGSIVHEISDNSTLTVGPIVFGWIPELGLHRIINGERAPLYNEPQVQREEPRDIPQPRATRSGLNIRGGQYVTFSVPSYDTDYKPFDKKVEEVKHDPLFKNYKMKPILINDSKILKEFYSDVLSGIMKPLLGWELSPGKVVFKNKSGSWIGRETKGYKINEEALVKNVQIKIISAGQSGDIFGYKKAKKEYIGKVFTVEEVIRKFKCKRDGVERDCLIIPHPTIGNLKFLASDVEIQYPEVKNVAFPKNRTINVNSTVVCKNNKNLRIRRGEQVKVLEVKKDPRGYTRTLKVQDNNNKVHTVLAKKFKVL